MNIKIGQYILGDSILHKMDPRIKLMSMILLIASVFTINISSNLINIIWISVMFLLSVTMVFLSGIPFGKVIQGLKGVVFLLTFTFFIQLFTVQPADKLPLLDVKMSLSLISMIAIIVLFLLYQVAKKKLKIKTTLFFIFVALIFLIQYLAAQYIPSFAFDFRYDFKVYEAGLINAGFIFLRITTVMIIASLLTFTTSTIELNDGLEALLTPFRLIGIPTYILSMMFSLTLRTIPTLLEETQKIIKAQTSRGADFNESKLKEKIGHIIALLIPVLGINLARADDLSNAMEARGYIIGEKRTKIDVYKIRVSDIIAISFSVAILAAIIVSIYAL